MVDTNQPLMSLQKVYYDISTCSNSGSKDFSNTALKAMQFSNDGKKLFLFDETTTFTIQHYSLASPYDISSPTLVKEYSGSASSTLKQFMDSTSEPQGFKFSADGTKMYLCLLYTSDAADD